MASITIKKQIAAPPERVFEAMIDVPSWPERIDAILAIEMLTEGPIRVGTRFRETRKMFGREATEEMEFTEIEPPRRFLLAAESHGSRYLTEHSVEPAGSGSEVTLFFQAIPQTLFAKIMMVIFALLMRKVMKECEKDLENLKSHLEGSGGGSTEAAPEGAT